MENKQKILKMPSNAGQLLFANDSFQIVGLMPQNKFIKYCKERGVDLTSKRLRNFERLGILKPIVRFNDNKLKENECLFFPNSEAELWFNDSRLNDTCDTKYKYEAVWTCLIKMDTTFKEYNNIFGGYNDPKEIYQRVPR